MEYTMWKVLRCQLGAPIPSTAAKSPKNPNLIGFIRTKFRQIKGNQQTMTKFIQFWRFSGYNSMTHFRSLFLYVSQKMSGNQQCIPFDTIICYDGTLKCLHVDIKEAFVWLLNELNF